ncbi:GTP 3',8-cyclase MoaA [Roseivirga seohaensis]|uniref:GTP 3',8-cyclase MoaA n=1 Tax=Roseivirga seohaensis TaxID=1914963 RepID=UPI003BA89CF4
MLYDNHGRQLRYLRLGVTERCNLRCFYCMPEEGLNFSHRSQILSFEEMERLTRILAEMGINKVRITGGEPFVRKNIMELIENISAIEGIDSVNITTNGTSLIEHLPKLKAIGIDAINLSLDCLDKERFLKITRRDEYDQVMNSFQALMDSGITTKINMVVMEEHNLEDIIPMCELTLQHKVNVRFIEEMPFNGGGKKFTPITWNARQILAHIQGHYPNVEKLTDAESSTSLNYQLPNAKGSFGIIPAYTRTICHSCDRIRLTPKGELKTCLYDGGSFSFRDFMRAGATDEEIRNQFRTLFSNRAKDGFEAQQKSSNPFESMATIGG